MGIVTKTIGSAGGRDYSTLQAWEDALPANLVTDGNSQIGDVYNDSEFTSANANILTISGETTDSTHTITLRAAAGQGFSDNANVQTNALAYNQANGVGIRMTSGAYVTLVTVSTGVPNVFFTGLQIKGNVSQALGLLGGPLVVASKCIFDGGDANTNINSAPVVCKTLLNCLMLSRGTGTAPSHFWRQVNTTGLVVNTTFIRLGAATNAAGLGYQNGTFKNCAWFGAFNANIAIDHGTATVSFCATDNASLGVTGTGGTITNAGSNLLNKTFANQFVSTTTDFKLKTGSDCVDAATTDTTDIPSADDIAGTTRPQGSAWDIGCWELIQAVASTDQLLGQNWM